MPRADWRPCKFPEKLVGDIDDALNQLRLIHEKYQLPGAFAQPGASELAWPAMLPSSPEVELLYTAHAPSGVRLETGAMPMKLHGRDTLEQGQVGYRWSSLPAGLQRDEAWPDAWLVIMDIVGGGNPVIAVTNEAGTPVLAGYDGVGPFKVADSLADFVLAMSSLIDIVYGEFDVSEVGDDDGPSEAFAARVTESIEPLLRKDNFARFADYLYG
jgi:hypothetical protein